MELDTFKLPTVYDEFGQVLLSQAAKFYKLNCIYSGYCKTSLCNTTKTDHTKAASRNFSKKISRSFNSKKKPKLNNGKGSFK